MKTIEYKNFTVQTNPEYPTDGVWKYPEYCFPDKMEFNVTYSTIKVVTPSGTWVGHFAPGYGGGIDKVCVLPDESKLLVAVSGAVYYVDVLNPAETHVIRTSMPVHSIVESQENGYVFLNADIEIYCINKAGVKWLVDSVALDHLKIVSTMQDTLICTGMTDYYDDFEEILIDMHTGKVMSKET